MSIELMLLAVNITRRVSREFGEARADLRVLISRGRVSAIGIAILVTLFRNRRTINVAEIDTLKG